MKTHHVIILVFTVLLVGGFFLWPLVNTQPQVSDELAGTWRGQAAPEEDYQWFMEYTFDQGRYTLTTDSVYAEEGTYEITQRFLDGSMLVKKVYADGNKTYEMSVQLTQDPNTIMIEGATLKRK